MDLGGRVWLVILAATVGRWSEEKSIAAQSVRCTIWGVLRSAAAMGARGTGRPFHLQTRPDLRPGSTLYLAGTHGQGWPLHTSKTPNDAGRLYYVASVAVCLSLLLTPSRPRHIRTRTRIRTHHTYQLLRPSRALRPVASPSYRHPTGARCLISPVTSRPHRPGPSASAWPSRLPKILGVAIRRQSHTLLGIALQKTRATPGEGTRFRATQNQPFVFDSRQPKPHESGSAINTGP